MRRVLLFIALLSSIYSCKKNKMVVVNGKVTNKLTTTGVANIPVTLYECNGIPQKCFDVIQESNTDVNGNYSINFESPALKSHKVGINNNDFLVPNQNNIPLYDNKLNKIDFELFPYQILKTNIKVLRHDKNWLQIDLNSTDNFESYGYLFYNNENPLIDFEKTYIVKIAAGRTYNLRVVLRNKRGPYTYTQDEFFNKLFAATNSDTTKVDFVVQ